MYLPYLTVYVSTQLVYPCSKLNLQKLRMGPFGNAVLYIIYVYAGTVHVIISFTCKLPLYEFPVDKFGDLGFKMEYKNEILIYT